MLAIEIIDEKSYDSNKGALIGLFKSEGMEVLSIETRPLDIQEAMYLNIRQLQEKEDGLDKLMNPGFDQN